MYIAELGNTPVSRRHFQCGENAPTAVGGYILSANRPKYELSGLGLSRGRVLHAAKIRARGRRAKPARY
jgi:hypothetical protein